jgi:hypothetical protein
LKVQECFYIPHPDWEEEYLEVEKAQIWKEFVRNWQYIKVYCVHNESFYLIKMLEREDDKEEEVTVKGDGHRAIELDFEEGEIEEEGEMEVEEVDRASWENALRKRKEGEEGDETDDAQSTWGREEVRGTKRSHDRIEVRMLRSDSLLTE